MEKNLYNSLPKIKVPYPNGRSRRNAIDPNLIRDVFMGQTAILTPEDPQRYLRTVGVSTCSVVTLYFPNSGIIALSHMLPKGCLPKFIAIVKSELEGRTLEAPWYYVEEGPANRTLIPDDNYYRNKDPLIIQTNFPGAKASDKAFGFGRCGLDVIIDKITGVTRVYDMDTNEAKSPRLEDFEKPSGWHSRGI